MVHKAEKFFKRYNGPMAIVGGCNLCRHVDTVRKPMEGHRGRGWGFVEGNKQRGRMIQHIKDAHPEVLREPDDPSPEATTHSQEG